MSDSRTSRLITGGGGGGAVIGDTVTGGTPESVLFVDSLGNLGQDNPGLTYDATTNELSVGGSVLVSDFARILNVATDIDYFVATTGNDANDGLTALTPFLTIQHAINVACTSLRSGKVTINVADGTYNESIECGSMIGAFDYDPSVDIFQGKSVIEIKGNSVTPANVIIDSGAGSFNTIRLDFTGNTVYIFDGMTVQGDTASSTGIQTNRANFIIRNINFDVCAFGLFIDNYSLGFWDFGLACTINASFLGVQNIDTSTFFIAPDLTITSPSGIFTQFDAFTFLFGNITGTGTGAVSDRAFQQNDRGILEIFSTTIILNDYGQGFITIHAARTLPLGTAITFNNVTAPHVFEGDAFYTDFGSPPTYSYLLGTPSTVALTDNSVLQSSDVFSGATLVYTESDANFAYGYDFRYVEPITGHHAGALPLGATVFLTKANSQSNEFPLYIAEQDEVIDQLRMVSVVGNGAAHTDTYAVFKNGVLQTMSLAITNASSGSTTTNPVTLAAGDRVAIRVVTDAATAAENVMAQLKIRKI